MIDPPDGDMKAYLEALERLLTEDFDYILPAHGWVLGFAHESIRQLIAHRLKRESKVLSAVRELRRGNMQQLLPKVYDDVDPIMYPVAQRSLLAHLLKLEADLTIRRSGEEWAAV